MTPMIAAVTSSVGKGESDPLAELARLIGQNRSVRGMGRPIRRTAAHECAHQYQPPRPMTTALPPPAAVVQRAARHESPRKKTTHRITRVLSIRCNVTRRGMPH